MPFLVQEQGAPRGLRQLLLLLVGAFALTLAACTSGGGEKLANVSYEPASFGAPDPATAQPAEVVAEARPTIAPYDKLDIKVFQVEDLSGEFQVSPTGQIVYPLIGQITAAGKTPTELAQLIAARLGAKHLRSPNVQVNLMEAAPTVTERLVTVDGSVNEPGAFPIKGPMTLMRAVALAKGLEENANPRRVIIFRTVNGQRLAGGFDLAAIRRAQAEDPAIYPNDIIVVDAKKGNAFQTLFDRAMQTLPVLAIFRPF